MTYLVYPNSQSNFSLAPRVSIDCMFGRTKKGTSKKRVKSIQVVDMHCRIMSDLLSENGDDAVQSWRIFRIMSEFVDGFELLRKYGTAATFFGSARSKPGDVHFEAAKELSGLLAKSGFSIITGGGHGIMEAANVGAYNAGGQSVGLNISIPLEQKLNPYVTDSKTFHFFFSRKVMLAFAAEVYIYFPGGFGTLDELFEILTLVQTKKISPVPIILYNKKFWEPLIDVLTEKIYEEEHMVDKDDLKLFTVVDSVKEAYAYITKNVDPCAPRQI